MTIDPKAEAAQLLELIPRSWNVNTDALQRLGAFALAWAAFENGVERLIWFFGGVAYKSVRPPTDLLHGEPLIKMLEKHCLQTGIKHWDASITSVAATARIVQVYRNAIAHGIPNSLGTTIANASTYGEVRQKNPSIAVLRIDILNIALAVTATLIKFSADALHLALQHGPQVASGSVIITQHLASLREAEGLAAQLLDVEI